MKHHVSIWKQLEPYNTFVGSVWLANDSAVRFSQDKISIAAQGKGGFSTNLFACFCFPDPTVIWHESLKARAESEGVSIWYCVVKANLEWSIKMPNIL